jgi:hypothetical protein
VAMLRARPGLPEPVKPCWSFEEVRPGVTFVVGRSNETSAYIITGWDGLNAMCSTTDIGRFLMDFARSRPAWPIYALAWGEEDGGEE